MKVTAKELMAAWLDNSPSMQHTENKPVGRDRKQVEGPFQTQEDFPNSWMPTHLTEREQECEPVAEVTEVEVTVVQAAADDIFPGVSRNLFKSWQKAHDSEASFGDSHSFQDFERLTNDMARFLVEAQRAGSSLAQDNLRIVSNYALSNAPQNGRDFDPYEAKSHLEHLDKILNAVHEQVLQLTNTSREDWYYNDDGSRRDRNQDDSHMKTPVMYLTPEESAELGMPERISPQELSKRRGPGESFLQELWRRKKETELRGMRIKAIDVIRKKKTRVVAPPVEEEVNTNIEPPELETEQPGMAPGEPNLMFDPETDLEGDPDILAQPIANWDWEDDEDNESNFIISYRKTIHFNHPDDEYGNEDPMELYAFVDSNAGRKKRLLEQVQRARRFSGPGTGAEQELKQEAEGWPTAGFINDIEIFYKGELLFHRERSFMPKRPALDQREFMAGDAMQRAVTDLQQYIRTSIDPVPVGKFIQQSLANPGKGRNKLSHKKGDTMKITAGDVLPLDPKKRKLKGPEEKSFGLGPSKKLQQWFSKDDRDPGVADYAREIEQEGPGGTPIDDPAGGDAAYHGLLYQFDMMSRDMEEMAKSLIQLQPSLNPAEQKDAGRVIAKIKAAIKALSL